MMNEVPEEPRTMFPEDGERFMQLGPGQQELIENAYSSEHSIRQLADRLGQAAQTVYNRLFRLRRLLFDCVQRRLASERQS